MPFTRRHTLALLGASALVSPAATAQGTRDDGIDWSAFLGRHDLIWDRLPKAWDEGPFLGNGMLGAMAYYDAAAGALRIDVGRADVQDHRKPMKQGNFDNARLPIGHFLLRTKGKVADKCALRLVLRDATMTGEITTDRGRIALKAYVHADDMAIVVETRATAGESGFEWEWVGEQADSPRQTFAIVKNEMNRGLKDYKSNLAGTRTNDGNDQLWLQPLLAGGGTATAWRTTPTRLVVSVAHQFPGDGARAEVLAALRKFVVDPTAHQRHVAWWRNYYPASFITIPDTRVESFYWIQLYKIASATRSDRALVDNQGPWLQLTPWPSIWWNLNVQLTYWTPVAANQIHLTGSLVRALHDHRDALINNVDPQYRADSASINRTSGSDLDSPVGPPKMGGTGEQMSGMASVGRAPEVGDLPWTLHNVWMVWRHTMDEGLLRDKLFPLLRRTTNYYRHFLTKGADGKLHLPPTYSPEYASAPDLNYDLAILRWSCTALIEAAARLKIDDPLIPEWKRILAELVDYPTDTTGYLIGAGQPLKSSHRHYSHILMAYPFYLVNKEQAGAAELVQRTVDHWQSMPEQLRGYSSTGASSISAAFGKGDLALKYLRGLFDDYLRPNTLYKESGPVIETPLSGAQAVLDMLIQSWGGTIRVFPAVPGEWRDAAFADLSAEGAFLVSAKREQGKTRWIRVLSKAGEPFVLETDISDPVATVGGKPRALTRNAKGYFTCALAKGETILVYPRGPAPALGVRPLKAGVINSFGLNARSNLKVQGDMSLKN